MFVNKDLVEIILYFYCVGTGKLPFSSLKRTKKRQKCATFEFAWLFSLEDGIFA